MQYYSSYLNTWYSLIFVIGPCCAYHSKMKDKHLLNNVDPKWTNSKKKKYMYIYVIWYQASCGSLYLMSACIRDRLDVENSPFWGNLTCNNIDKWHDISSPSRRETVAIEVGLRSDTIKEPPTLCHFSDGDFSSNRGGEEDATRHLNRKQSVGNYVHIRVGCQILKYKIKRKKKKQKTRIN